MVLADRYDAFLLDLDGVLYRGDLAVPGAADAVEALRARGGRLVFLTNNSSKTPKEVEAKLTSLGIGATVEEVVTSALATADFLAARGGGSVFVIGETGILEALADAGMRVISGVPDSADYVVVGLDRNADYAKLRTAALLVQRGARLVATNADASLPVEGALWPGAGALLAAITATTGATAEVVGKPHAPLFRAAAERAGAKNPLVVGDRLDTDIAGAAAIGWDSVLVLTGVSRKQDLEGSDVQPTFVGTDLSCLLADSVEAVRR